MEHGPTIVVSHGELLLTSVWNLLPRGAGFFAAGKMKAVTVLRTPTKVQSGSAHRLASVYSTAPVGRRAAYISQTRRHAVRVEFCQVQIHGPPL